MQRRFIAGIAAAAAAALVLTGCSAGSSASDGQSKDALTWAMWIGGKEDKAAWQKVADTVDTKDSVKVTIQGSPFNDYWTKLRTQLSTGTAPCIVSIQSLRAANYTDVLVPLDDLAKKADLDLSEYDQTALTGMKVDGKLYGLPYDTGPMLVFYNKDLLKKAGVDDPKPGWTTDEFEAAAAKLKAAGTTAYGTSIADIPLESQILGYNGGRVITESGKLDATDPKFADGLDWLAGLVKKGYATQASSDSSADGNAFVSGDVAMYSDGPWSLISQKAKVKFDLGVTTVPSGTSGASSYAAGSGFGVSKQCKYPDQAFKAIETMTSEPVLTSLAKQGRAFPARTAAQQAWYDNAGIDGAEDTLKAALDKATPLPGNKQSDQLNQLFTQYALQAVNGQTSGKDTMSSISSQLGSQ
ncbi:MULTISPECIES: sugar ABC transporter substrate-binding protein [unclassified Curtobacterium]|uniref:ABC transporter substrate-binding protein n=1 Tax=unclassified Curtobacterium TaxID=257496 RepID=UPI000F9683BA|nr:MULTISPECIES: sugar ABC transporter substrate-binding protein [unclassified Curtobacterium]ROP58802.1 multiple sugar transport system substrate-binding protein/raffinose/stachyose/melibiose transport system substrate-binding protein [Curtobacterium sp. ZW137]TCK66472.1 multiple sugar transport system substrate-binding protein/raffinose/stachyose/melibiose transport system substrate-binding protein [Curtobacterium sp. PhB136]